MPLILTGRQVSAEEGWRLGFVSELVEPGGELEAAKALAMEIADCGPAAIRAAKEVAMHGEDLPLALAIAGQGDLPMVQAMRASPDYVEGPRAFAEKRLPHWSCD
ncbi:enoyl-CoA hydratase/isomerase-like protein [Novosphingobium sp. GV055]|nr:enoyl-CoA hydratase/isomerase-like protein [Novosphingobium sp. GV055]PUB06346.1 enoyl-CoA hydratase/isomerase-like protein [Novosphingobium sp. GV061]PUB22397.1 enoyl-CoA hydratase/isomerase-like protein [Novosphingobium sp. GV079]PUB44422.1 enoyl-CoA hydratase/isomerase-like protein [Novosphingobium sp. GV027]